MSKGETKKPHSKSFERIYNENAARFEKTRKNAHNIVAGVLKSKDIPFLQVQSRVKSLESTLGKIAKKEYLEPLREITDFVGLRAIVYLESDVDKAAEILRQTFSIDEDNSVDKRHPESPNTMGYRSLHLICRLGSGREKHQEYSGICDIPFEVQLRTALTHTWAEIEHKQKYKSSQALPKRLQRKLNLISATLESADLQLDDLSRDAANYRNDLRDESNKEVEKDEISDTSLKEISIFYASKYAIALSPPDRISYDQIINDLSDFDVKTVGDLRKFLKSFPGHHLKDDQKEDTISGFLSLAMAANDLDTYLKIMKKNGRAILSHRVIKYENVTQNKKFKEKLREKRVDITASPVTFPSIPSLENSRHLSKEKKIALQQALKNLVGIESFFDTET